MVSQFARNSPQPELLMIHPCAGATTGIVEQGIMNTTSN